MGSITAVDVVVILLILLSAGFAAWKGFLSETNVILDYIEAAHPSPALVPADAFAAAKVRAAKLEGVTILVRALASEQGKLYGSVGPAEIARAAEGQKVDLEKSEINLISGPIRTVGEFKVLARLHSEVETELTVKVEEEKA